MQAPWSIQVDSGRFRHTFDHSCRPLPSSSAVIKIYLISTMSCVKQQRPPLARNRRVAVASVCAVAVAATAFTPSSSQYTALAFSRPHVVSSSRPSASVVGADSVSHSSTLSILRPCNGFVQIDGVRNAPGYGGLTSSSLSLHKKPKKYDIDLTALHESADEGVPTDESAPTKESSSSSLQQDLQSVVTLVGAQALLIPISIVLANILNIPNRGLGLGFEWTQSAAVQGIQWTLPLFGIAAVLQVVEPYSQSLQDVTKATQRSVLTVMGKERRPVFALLVSILLGACAGWGEEWLFRGVFQTVLSEKFSSNIALGISGVVFGLLHAVTPIYALLAGVASVFFGYLYNVSGNLAVPMICHAVYDVGALMFAHWSVTALTSDEQKDLLQGGPGAPIMDSAINKE